MMDFTVRRKAMNRAISARVQGDDYQALFSWLYIVKLFQPHTSVCKVVYEADNVKSFDDVVVYYREDKPRLDCRHNKISMDCFQVKYHVTQDGTFTWDGLKDPNFINAKSYSIMQRLLDAHRKYCIDGNNVRFYLVAPWQIHPDDVLAKLYSNQEGEIRIDKLFDDSIPPGTKQLRKAMKKHLAVEDDDLLRIFETLRIWKDSFTMERLIEELNKEFSTIGFKPIENSSLINPYIGLVKQWNIREICEYTREFIIDECTREGLYESRSVENNTFTDLGIRSFYRRAENMEDETESMLCLLKYYDDRHLKENIHWQPHIQNEIEQFISNKIEPGKSYRLHLDTHLSNAFLAGYNLDTKSGIEIYPAQKTIKGRVFWKPEMNPKVDYPNWITNYINRDEENLDMALVLGVTHDICDEVKHYIDSEGLKISTIINCCIDKTQGNNSVIDGYHAKMLADNISLIVKKRSVSQKRSKLHIFSASPVALMFVIGQVARSFGNIILYEFDFDGTSNNSYLPSYELPMIREGI